MVKLIFALLVLLTIGAGVYVFVYDKTDSKQALVATPTPQGTTTAQAETDTTATIKDVVQVAVANKSYTDLDVYLTEPVHVILYANECCGNITKEAAIKQLSYLDSAKEQWSFDQENEIAKTLRDAVPEYFQNAVIGVSGDIVVAFRVNAESMIDQIAIVPAYTLVAPDTP